MSEATSAGAGVLRARLEERASASVGVIPAEQRAVMTEAIESLRSMDLPTSAIGVGDAAPDFELSNARGERVRLSTLLRDGPVVLTWYRGGWCPYCNLQLRAYQERLADITAAGGRLVAISPETPDNALSTAEKNELAFEVLSDAGSAVARAWGIAFELGDPLVEVYRGFGINLPEHNGDAAWTLPLAATYVIGRDGTVAMAFLEEDYKKRAEPDDVIASLRSLEGR